MATMTDTERESLLESIEETISRTRNLGYWLRTASPTVTEDDYEVDVEVEEYENYVNLGEFGEQTQYLNVSTTTRTTVEVEVDVEDVMRTEAPDSAAYLEDDVVPVLSTALDYLRSLSDRVEVPTVEPPRTGSEERVARAAVALAGSFLADEPDAIVRALGAALVLARGPVERSPFASLDYDPRTVPTGSEYSGSVLVRELRLGDIITGQTFGRVVSVERVEGYSNRVRLTLLSESGVESERIERTDTSYYINPIEPSTGRARAEYLSALDLLDSMTDGSVS